MNARGYRDAIKRQQKREQRAERRAERREKAGRAVRTFALIAAGAAAVYGGKKLVKSGALNDIITSKGLKNLVDDGRALGEFVEGYSKAVSATYRSKGLGIFTQDTSKTIGRNLTKYLGDYSKRTGDISTESIKGVRYLAELAKQRKIFKDREISKIQQDVTRNIIKNATTDDDKSKKAADFLNKIIDKEWQDIYLGSNSRKSPNEHNFVYDKILMNVSKYAGKSGDDVKEFEDELRNILGAIKDDDSFKVAGGKTSQESFIEKVIDSNKQLREGLARKEDSFYKNAVRDIKTSLDVENTKTGKLFDEAGLEKMTFKDILENPDLLQDQNLKTMGGTDFDPVKELNNMKEILSKEEYDDFLNTAVDTAILKNSKGDFTDLRYIGTSRNKALSWLGDTVEIPFVGIKPFKYFSMLDPSANRGGPMGYVFSRGTLMDTLTGSDSPLADDLYMMGSVVRDSAGNIIKDNQRLVANSPHDAIGNVVRRMSGRNVRTDDPNAFQKVTDFNMQNQASFIDKMMNKKANKEDPLSFMNIYERYVQGKKYDPSRINDIDKASIDYMLEYGYKEGRSHLKMMDSVTMGAFDPSQLGLPIDKVFAQDADSLYKALSSSNNAQEVVESFLQKADGEDYTALQQRIADIISNSTGGSSSYKYAAKEMQNNFFDIIGSDNIKTISKNLYSSGSISRTELDNLRDIAVNTELRDIILGQKSSWTKKIEYVNALNKDGLRGDFFRDIYKRSKKGDFELDYDLGADPFEGNKFISINRSSGSLLHNINEAIKNTQDGESIIENAFEVVANKVGEMGFGTKGFRAGRDAMDKVSTTSAISHFFFSRLSDGLSSAGLGLSSSSMGSTQDVAVNLYLKRILLPTAAIATVSYANYKIGDITGTEPSDALAGTYARMTLDVQKIKDITGINDFTQKWGHVLDGSEHLFENPVGMAIKYGTFGLIGDDSGYEEKEWYYERGEEEVRKGRLWGMGSNTPIYGGRVEQYRPSWYRRVIGEPKYTDALWGSKEEYWENHWLPTLDNPIGPLKKLLDPYHWENKHKESRPFVQTGGMQELQSIPIIGPALDGTIGRIIKPVRTNREFKSSHKEMLNNINNMITQQYYDEAQGGFTKFSGSSERVTNIDNPYGGTSGIPLDYDVDIWNDDIRDLGKYALDSAVGGINLPFGIEKHMGSLGSGLSSDINGQGYVQSYGGSPGTLPTTGSGSGSAAMAVNAQLTSMNQAVSKGQIQSSKSVDIDMVRDDFFVGDLSTVADPAAMGVRMSDMYHSATDIGGIYGFGVELLLGDHKTGPVLEDSSWAFSANRQFWDQNLGGLGGSGMGSDISEIVRRFILDNQHKDTYNPIRNTMPDWMPSYENYFIDFQHGDPYTKVPNGEEILPGPGYEAINKLNSDPYFGRYGALDRMKILGNVAPWSQQYQYYSKATTLLYQKGVYTDEQYEIAKRTREQVKRKKQKYDFSEYKFRDDDVDYRTVTIDTVLSDYSFTTVQNPGEVYKLAGINIPGANSEEGQAVRQYLDEVLHGGAKVRIAVAEDGLNYRGSDLKNSIKAAVFINGESLQNTLIRKYGVEGKYDDNDAATVHALYSQTERAIGSVWETITHMDLPIINKFMRNRSAVEEYERSVVYGKEFQDWKHPIDDWLKPTAAKIASQNPVEAVVTGMLIGAVLNKPKTGIKNRLLSMPALVAGTISGVLAGGRVVNETIHKATGDFDYTWTPEATQRRREINEYFDKLRYVKYKGLYEKTKALAKEYEGVDLEKLEEDMNETPYIDKRLRRELERVKKMLALSLSDGQNIDEQEAQYKTQLINDFIKGKSENDRVQHLGAYSRLALQYKKEYESTLYGADPYGDFMSIYAALPKEDKPFFQEFMTASPRDRKRILELVPENQKKFYKARWGMGDKKSLKKKENLYEYFEKYGIPDEDWEGWEPSESLEKVKANTLVKMHENPANYGYFDEDVRASRTAPKLGHSIQSSPVNRFNKNHLRRVLKGNGLKDVEVFQVGSFVNNRRDQTRIDIDIKNNVKREMENAYYTNIGNYM